MRKFLGWLAAIAAVALIAAGCSGGISPACTEALDAHDEALATYESRALNAKLTYDLWEEQWAIYEEAEAALAAAYAEYEATVAASEAAVDDAWAAHEAATAAETAARERALDEANETFSRRLAAATSLEELNAIWNENTKAMNDRIQNLIDDPFPSTPSRRAYEAARDAAWARADAAYMDVAAAMGSRDRAASNADTYAEIANGQADIRDEAGEAHAAALAAYIDLGCAVDQTTSLPQ